MADDAPLVDGSRRRYRGGMRFTTTLKQAGKNATGIEVPSDVVESLGAGKRPPVTVTIGDYRYRSTIGSMGGVPMIPFAAEHREASGIVAGDEIEVDLALDTEPRIVEIPDDLGSALNAAALMDAFRELSYSNQRAHVLSVEGAKAAETRARRVDKVIAALRG